MATWLDQGGEELVEENISIMDVLGLLVLNVWWAISERLERYIPSKIGLFASNPQNFAS